MLIKLTETGVVPNQVQLLRVGTFESDSFGKLEITKDILLSLKKNFDDKVRGYEDGKLPIDYFHENEKIAGGWIESLSLSGANDDELWAQVKWTPKAMESIKGGELRYLSAEFSFNYKSNEGGQSFGPTLFGAGLTNRPFVKKMDPIMSLSDGIQKYATEIQKHVADLIPQLVALGHSQEKAIAIAYSKCGEIKMAELNKPTGKGKGDKKMNLEQAMAKIAELEAQIKELQKDEAGEPDAPATPAAPDAAAAAMDLKAMKDKVACAEKALADEIAKNTKSEKFTKMLSEGKAVEAQRSAFMTGDMIKFSELAKPTNARPSGSEADDSGSGPGKPALKSAQDKVLELAEKEKKSLRVVLSEHPDLREAYEKEVAV